MRISSELHKVLLAMAAASPNAEICGLLIGKDHIEQIVPARNVAADPRCHFEIDPKTLFAAIRAEREGGGQLIGYYHSHPLGPATPSVADAVQAAADGRLWLIIAEDQITAWSMTESGQFKGIEYDIEH